MGAVYIRDALRSPRGKARPDGGLAGLTPPALVGGLHAALVTRAGGDLPAPGALLLGCVTQVGGQGGNIAMAAKLAMGLPDSATAHSINNYCASGLTALGHGVAMVAAGHEETVLAGGVEQMSRVPFLSDAADFYTAADLPPGRRFVLPVLAADRLAAREGISREELDQCAALSHQRALASDQDPALQASRIALGGLAGEECPRPGMTAERLAAMPPAFAGLQAEHAAALAGETFPALHTLAHAPPVCDGAGLAMLSASATGARARVLAYAESGGDPVKSLTAGAAAMERALARAGLELGAIDRIEYMEAFAVTLARFLRRHAPDPTRVNVTGGHLAKGHPMGATGAVLLSTLLDSLDASGHRLGLVVATGAMGVGAAMVVERLV